MSHVGRHSSDAEFDRYRRTQTHLFSLRKPNRPQRGPLLQKLGYRRFPYRGRRQSNQGLYRPVVSIRIQTHQDRISLSQKSPDDQTTPVDVIPAEPNPNLRNPEILYPMSPRHSRPPSQDPLDKHPSHAWWPARSANKTSANASVDRLAHPQSAR